MFNYIIGSAMFNVVLRHLSVRDNAL